MPASDMKASSNDENIRVANVEKPSGEIKSVIGSSFMVDRMTKPAAAPSPGAINGRSTRMNLEILDAPNVCPAS